MADKFKLIGITTPLPHKSFREEGKIITDYLLSESIDFFHIRKKNASVDYTFSLVSSIDSSLHSRLVLHCHYELLSDFSFGGVHRTPQDVKLRKGLFFTRSCHFLSECTQNSNLYYYSFLSPIYDSISKLGYKSNFDIYDSELINTVENRNIIALGGVKPEFFENLFNSKFAGAALLGYLWSPKEKLDKKIKNLLDNKTYYC